MSFIATLLLSLTYLSFVGAARSTAAVTFSQTADALFRRLEAHFQQTLYNVNVVSIALATFCNISNDTFVRFNDDLRRLRNTTKQHDSTTNFVSLPRHIVYAKIVQHSELVNHILEIQTEGFKDYSVFAYDDNHNRIVSNQSDSYLPIVYNYPIANSNFSVRGFNIFSDLERAKLVTVANGTKSPVVSSKLLSVDSMLPAFFIYDPVFTHDSQQLAGVVGYAFFIDSLMRDILFDIDTESMQFIWKDVTNAADEITMFSSNSNITNHDSLTHRTTTISFTHRQWKFDVFDLNMVSSLPGSTIEWMIVVAVLLFCFIVSITVFVQKYTVSNQSERKIRQLMSIVVPNHVGNLLLNNVRVLQDGQVVLQGNTMIAEAHQNVSLCFIDICNFTILSSCLSPKNLVAFLDEFMSIIDGLSEKHRGLMKIKTIGDAYFVVAGLNSVNKSAVEVATNIEELLSLLDFALDVLDAIKSHRFRVERLPDTGFLGMSAHSKEIASKNKENQRRSQVLDQIFDPEGFLNVNIRIGIHYGDVVAGVVGKLRPQFDVWGDACNVAARVESSAENGTIQISSMAYNVLRMDGQLGRYSLAKRELSLKGIGHFTTYSLARVTEDDMKDAADSRASSRRTSPRRSKPTLTFVDERRRRASVM